MSRIGHFQSPPKPFALGTKFEPRIHDANENSQGGVTVNQKYAQDYATTGNNVGNLSKGLSGNKTLSTERDFNEFQKSLNQLINVTIEYETFKIQPHALGWAFR
jgi:hypothetical protein